MKGNDNVERRRARNNWRVISQKSKKILTRPGHFLKFDYSKMESENNQLFSSHENLVYKGSFGIGFM